MLARALVIAFGLAAGGCVPIPLPRSAEAAVDAPLPDVRPYLPADVLGSKDEMLVLAQLSRLHHPSFFGNRHAAQSDGPLLTAAVTRANELDRLGDRVQLKYSRRLLVVTVLATGHEAYYTDSLTRLCLVAADGRTFVLWPGENGWSKVETARLEARRRDLFVTDIRAQAPRGSRRFATAPCAVGGYVSWPHWQQGEIEAFLARVPAD